MSLTLLFQLHTYSVRYPKKTQNETKLRTNDNNKYKQIGKQTEKQENRIKRHSNSNNNKK